MKEEEMREIAGLIDMALSGNYEANKAEIISRVNELTRRFPLYS
jgi:glycine/serine hydroxymethyltransferase